MSHITKSSIPKMLRKLYYNRTHLMRKLCIFSNKKNSGRKNLYLHIGLGKTGTTALQEFFWTNRRHLAQIGFNYPDYCVIAGAHHALSPHKPKFLQAIPFKPVEEWAPIIAQSDQTNILLSSELIAWTATDLIRDYCAELKKYFNLKIIIYVRRQDELIMAAYNQQVKAGLQKQEIHEILEKQINRFDFKDRIQLWADCVGAGNVTIRPFERKQFYQGDIRLDFLYHVFGITDFSGFELGQDTNSNPRLSSAALEYKRLLNLLFDDPEMSNRYNKLLLKYSAETDKNSTRIYAKNALLSPRDRLYILDRFEEYNNFLCEKYLTGANKLFLDGFPDVNEQWRPVMPSKNELQEITSYIQKSDYELYSRLLGSFDNLPSEKHEIFSNSIAHDGSA